MFGEKALRCCALHYCAPITLYYCYCAAISTLLCPSLYTTATVPLSLRYCAPIILYCCYCAPIPTLLCPYHSILLLLCPYLYAIVPLSLYTTATVPLSLRYCAPITLYCCYCAPISTLLCPYRSTLLYPYRATRRKFPPPPAVCPLPSCYSAVLSLVACSRLCPHPTQLTHGKEKSNATRPRTFLAPFSRSLLHHSGRKHADSALNSPVAKMVSTRNTPTYISHEVYCSPPGRKYRDRRVFIGNGMNTQAVPTFPSRVLLLYNCSSPGVVLARRPLFSQDRRVRQ